MKPIYIRMRTVQTFTRQLDRITFIGAMIRAIGSIYSTLEFITNLLKLIEN